MYRPLLLITVWLLAVPLRAADLVIVVDDLGYSLPRAEQVLALPGPVTLGVLPFAPETAIIADRARQTGHEIILHQPMEALAASHPAAESGTLTLDMSAARFQAQMDAALRAVPGAVGLNNHTGSRLTQDPIAMHRLMHYLAERDLLFLDSRTTPLTIAYAVACETQVPALQRDVFLDHVMQPGAIEAEFHRALIKAREQGYAVIIAHPHPESLAFLAETLQRLPDWARLVSLRDLSDRTRPAVLARHESPASPHRSLGQ